MVSFLPTIERQMGNLPKPNQKWNLIATITNKKPISVATNDLDKTHPRMAKFNPLRKAHAELRCINNAPRGKLKNATITVVRWNNDGWRMAKPCGACMAYIKEVGIKKIIYSTNDNTFEEMRV